MAITANQTKVQNADGATPYAILQANPRRAGWVLIWHRVSSLSIQFGDSTLPMTTFISAANPFICNYRDYGPLCQMRVYVYTGGFFDFEIDELLYEAGK